MATQWKIINDLSIYDIIGVEMIIRCHASNRFLCEIDIEDWQRQLAKIGVSQQTPLKIKVPCRTCKCTEHYDLYEGRAIFKGSEKHNIKV